MSDWNLGYYSCGHVCSTRVWCSVDISSDLGAQPNGSKYMSSTVVCISPCASFSCRCVVFNCRNSSIFFNDNSVLVPNWRSSIVLVVDPWLYSRILLKSSSALGDVDERHFVNRSRIAIGGVISYCPSSVCCWGSIGKDTILATLPMVCDGILCYYIRFNFSFGRICLSSFSQTGY